MEYAQENVGHHGKPFLATTTKSALIYLQDRADLADKAKDGNLDFFRSQGFDF